MYCDSQKETGHVNFCSKKLGLITLGLIFGCAFFTCATICIYSFKTIYFLFIYSFKTISVWILIFKIIMIYNFVKMTTYPRNLMPL